MRVVSLALWTLRRSMEYLIREYPLQQGALEIAYIEEYFNEFPRRKTATDIVQRLEDRESQILMAEAPLADDPAVVVPVSYKVSHELQADETDPHLAVQAMADDVRGERGRAAPARTGSDGPGRV